MTEAIVEIAKPPGIAGHDPTLFLGYVEFDWDPASPGGVPGFGQWPPPSWTNIASAGMEN
jgi:hypothetical protein